MSCRSMDTQVCSPGDIWAREVNVRIISILDIVKAIREN